MNSFVPNKIEMIKINAMSDSDDASADLYWILKDIGPRSLNEACAIFVSAKVLKLMLKEIPQKTNIDTSQYIKDITKIFFQKIQAFEIKNVGYFTKYTLVYLSLIYISQTLHSHFLSLFLYERTRI